MHYQTTKKPLKVLIGCEFSGRVRDAFACAGHDATSVDILPSQSPGKHIQDDLLKVIASQSWDMLIAFPPCTDLATSGASHFIGKYEKQRKALAFVRKLMTAPIKQICIENPVSIISTHIKKPSQIIQPWQFGHEYTKATCLWLKNLPLLRPTSIVQPYLGSYAADEGQTEGRASFRSLTFTGVAEAMANQWGNTVYYTQSELFT